MLESTHKTIFECGVKSEDYMKMWAAIDREVMMNEIIHTMYLRTKEESLSEFESQMRIHSDSVKGYEDEMYTLYEMYEKAVY